MNILVLGGTKFIGKYFVELCQKKGETVTVANRGFTEHHLPSNIGFIKIDRESIQECKNLSNNIQYDCIVDFSCYKTNHFTNTINYIKCKKYILISSTGVNNIHEIDKTHHLYQYCIDKKNLETYVLNNSFVFPVIIVRPCIVYGHNDYTNRFEFKNNDFYWVGSQKKAKDCDNCISVEFLGSMLIKIIQSNNYNSNIIEIIKNV